MRQPTLFEAQTLTLGDRVRYVNALAGAIWGNRDIEGTVKSITPAADGDRAEVKWDTGHLLTTFVSALERA